MRYLLTGATGFIGGALLRQLLGAGHEVRALVRSPESAGPLAAAGATICIGNVADRESLRAPMTGVDGVFHVAGWYKIGARDRSPGRAINVEGTNNVLGVMKELGTPRGVYTSTLAVNSDTRGRIVDENYEFQGRHLSEYDRTKAEAHAIARTYASAGLPLVIVQPGLVYGPGDTSSVRTTLRKFLTRTLPPLPSRSAFSWGHVDDIAQGHLLAMERGRAGRCYFLAGPAHTLIDAIAVAADITGIPAPRLHVPAAVVGLAAPLMSAVERFIALPPEFTGEGLRVLAGVTYLGSSARSSHELGWQPRPLREGLTETLRHEMQTMRITPIR